jgi:hypothetical protein
VNCTVVDAPNRPANLCWPLTCSALQRTYGHLRTKMAHLIRPRADVADACIVRDDRDVRSLRARKKRSFEECYTQLKGRHEPQTTK